MLRFCSLQHFLGLMLHYILHATETGLVIFSAFPGHVAWTRDLSQILKKKTGYLNI